MSDLNTTTQEEFWVRSISRLAICGMETLGSLVQCSRSETETESETASRRWLGRSVAVRRFPGGAPPRHGSRSAVLDKLQPAVKGHTSELPVSPDRENTMPNQTRTIAMHLYTTIIQWNKQNSKKNEINPCILG